jgi:hypothetical protein
MQRHAASAVAAALLVAIGCSSSAAQTTGTASTFACPRGSLATVYGGTHKCLGLALRKRIYAALAGMRDRGTSGAAAYRAASRRYEISVDSVQRIDREGRARGWAVPPAPRLAAGVPVLSPGGDAAATQLRVTDVECSDSDGGLAVADLRWAPAADRGDEQRVAVTIYPGGFDRGQFESSAALSADRAAMTWPRVHGRAFHFFRVLTLHEDGWHPSATVKFEGVACIYDQRP